VASLNRGRDSRLFALVYLIEEALVVEFFEPAGIDDSLGFD
jgi:hypothetical protein